MGTSSGIAPLLVVAAGLVVFFLVLFMNVRIAVVLAADGLRSRERSSGLLPFAGRNRLLLLSLLTVAVTALSWFLNIGWYRFVFVVPMLAHLAAFLVINSFVHGRGALPGGVRRLVLADVVLFNLCYIVLPDAGDTADSARMFFGLVSDAGAVGAAWHASLVLFPASVIMMILIPFVLKFSGMRRNTAAPRP